MATPIIRSSASISGVITGSDRNDLDIGETVTLTDTQVANSGAAYQWTMEDKPIGSSTTITNPTSATASFVPDITGTYRIRCTVNGSAFDVCYLAVPLPVTGARIPSYLEDDTSGGGYNAGGNTKGWHESQTVYMRAVDAALSTAAFPGYGVVGNYSTLDIGDSAAAGGLSTVARADHQHPFPSPTVINDVLGTSGTLGSSTKAAREDHSHFHGAQTVATLHALATTSAHGFMSSADKAATIVTVSAEASLANSRRLVAGTNVTFDTSTPGILSIASSGGAGGYTTVENNGTPVTARSSINLSTEFTASDVSTKTAVALTTGGIARTKLATMAGLSVLGTSTTSTASPGVITGTADQVLRVDTAGTGLGFGTIATAGIANSAVTYAKVQNVGGLSVMGRSTNSSGVAADITGTTDQVLRVDTAGTGLSFGTIATAGITNSAVTYAKVQNVAGLSVMGRSANSSGVAADITGVTVGHVLQILAGPTLGFGAVAGSSGYSTIENNGTGVTQRTTLNLSTEFTASDVSSKTALALTTGGIATTKLATMMGLSILGTATTSIASPTAISGGGDQVLRVDTAGNNLAFGTIATGGITAAAVTYAKIQNVAGMSVMGRSTNSSGVAADITGTTDQVLRVSTAGTSLGFGTIATAGITDANVTYAKIQNVAGLSVMGRSANSSGVAADITGVTVGHVLQVLAGPTIGFGANSGSGANALGTYIVQTATNAPANAQILASLSTGMLKVATTTGVLTSFVPSANTIPLGSSGVLVDSTLTLASNLLTHAASGAGSAVGFTVSNSSTAASSNAQRTTVVAGTAAGDPFDVYTVTTGGSFSVGIDNDDSDYFKIHAGTALDTTTAGFRMATSGNVSFGVAAPSAGTGGIINIRESNSNPSIMSLGNVGSGGSKHSVYSVASTLEVAAYSAANTFLGTSTTQTTQINHVTGTGGLKIGTSVAADVALGANNVEIMRLTSTGGNTLLNGMAAPTSLAKGIVIANGTAPSASPSGGGALYVESGVLKFYGSSGTITTIAPA